MFLLGFSALLCMFAAGLVRGGRAASCRLSEVGERAFIAEAALHDRQYHVLFKGGVSLFSDLVDVSVYAAQPNLYSSDVRFPHHERIYPPLAYLILRPLHLLSTKFATGGSFSDTRCVLFMAAVFGGLTLVYIALLYQLSAGRGDGGWRLLTAMFPLTGIALYAFERGNQISLAAVLVAVFLLWYRRTGWRAQVAVFALAMATSLKVVPAFFALLPLVERRWRFVAWFVAESALLGLGPVLFIPGGIVENVAKLHGNVGEWGRLYFVDCPPTLTLPAHVAKFAQQLHLPLGLSIVLPALARFGTLILGFFSAFAVLLNRKAADWERWFLCAAVMVMVGSFTGYYALLYFMPALFAYLLSREAFSVRDLVLLPCCLVLCSPYQFGMDVTQRFSCNSLFCAVALVLVDAVVLRHVLVATEDGLRKE